MSPKPKPEEEPVWLNFTIEPAEKARWKAYAKKKGIPLATLIKMEVNKIVDEEFEAPLKALLALNKDIFGIAIIQDNLQILFKYGEIESDDDIRCISENWRLYTPVRRFRYLDEPMLIIQCSDDRLVIKNSPANSKGAITIVGHRMQNNIKFLARVKGDRNAITALADIQRVAARMFPPQPRSIENGMLEKSLPAFYQERSQLQSIDVLRRIPIVPQEQDALNAIAALIGKSIPAIPPFQNGDITKPNPQFDSTPVMYLTIDGHVVMLRLDRCNLKTIPKEIARFSELQHLSMNGNIIAEIPELLANLSTLKVLSLINNKIAWFPESIWNLQNIEEISLAGNPVTDLPGKDPSGNIPEARLQTLRNIVEGNIITLLNQLKATQKEMVYHSDNPPNLELVTIIQNFLNRIKQEFPEDVLHTYVFHKLSGD